MKNYLIVLTLAGSFVSGCYTSNQMVISGNRTSGGGNGVQRSNLHSISSQPKPQYVKQKQNVSSVANNSNNNTQTTTIYLTNNSSSNVVTNTTTFNSSKEPSVREFVIEESVIPGRYYIIQ